MQKNFEWLVDYPGVAIRLPFRTANTATDYFAFGNMNNVAKLLPEVINYGRGD